MLLLQKQFQHKCSIISLGLAQRKIMMLKSEMTFTNKLRSVGSRLRIFLSWLAGCFRFLLSFLARDFPKTPGLFCFHLRRWQERSFVCTLRLKFPAPLPSNLYTGCLICSSGYESIWNSKIMNKDHKKIFNLASKMQMQKS